MLNSRSTIDRFYFFSQAFWLSDLQVGGLRQGREYTEKLTKPVAEQKGKMFATTEWKRCQIVCHPGGIISTWYGSLPKVTEENAMISWKKSSPNCMHIYLLYCYLCNHSIIKGFFWFNIQHKEII